MGILDWFKNRPAQFETDGVSEDTIRRATEKAITLTNPRLSVVPAYQKRLAPAVAKSIEFLREAITALPQARPLSPTGWAADPALRAFFASPAEIPDTLGRSANLCTLFDKFPALDDAFIVLGMAFSEQSVLGIALHGETVQRDVVQKSVSFSDHRTHMCGRDEDRLKRVIGVQGFEFLVAQALAEIGSDRAERQELEANRALIRSRLRLLQQQGPGLGALFGAAPAGRAEQAKLEQELIENERQLEELGGNESALEMELGCLSEVLEHPERYVSITRKQFRLNTMNIVTGEESGEVAAPVDFQVAELGGAHPVRRAFVLATVARSEMPEAKGIDFADAARYL
ncbi:hypothetical protein [Accumulibacter sp.]|uniref:hypothetical protein n=1 Tax=Accumulibacter sp. TaxID=2053492 RepID=UPI0025F8E783|nr:hypothetical protein [Accumulibacter sp.]MCM8594985.1 hypothetical protein [Accumulibacter sp.]MCM8625624.1 hypothetical protein [Accumulibacter sp.]MDS4049131.1 hypothetical protein [Accumulibacter sp.]